MIKDKRAYSILVIEDNPGDYTLVEEYLEEQIASPHIVQATNFKQASAILAKAENKFNAILLDLTLPDRSGVNLITDIVSIATHCPVIILTGFADIGFSINSISKGISDYLIKDDLNAITLYKSIVYAIERKKHIAQLKESEKRYSDLFHFSPQPMWVYDYNTLRFLEVNNAAILSYGYSESEFLNMTIKDIKPSEDVHIAEKAFRQVMESKDFKIKGEFRHIKKNGEIINVEIHSSIVNYENKRSILILANDITDRLRHIKAIEKQNKQLQDIAWIQSHVVRAPLARMMGIVNFLKSMKCTNSEGEMLLQHFSDSSVELDNVIRSIVRKTENDNLK